MKNIKNFNDFLNEKELEESHVISYNRNDDNIKRFASGETRDEAIEKAYKRENGHIDHTSIKDEKINEDYTEAGENAGLYDELSQLIDRAEKLTGEEYELPEEAIIGLQFAIDNGILDDNEDAETIIVDIESTLDELDNVEAQAYYDDESLDDLLDEATELTGVECDNMSCAYKELRKLGTKEAMNLYYRFVQYEDDRASLLGVQEKFNPPHVDSSRYEDPKDMDDDDDDDMSDLDEPTEDDYEDYLNGMVGSEELMYDDEYKSLRIQAKKNGDEWMYQGNTYGTLLRNYDPTQFELGYNEYKEK